MAARLADNEQGVVRFHDLRLIHAPVVERDDAGLSTRKRGFKSRRGYSSGCRGEATPPVSGTGDRWFDSSRPDLSQISWRSAVEEPAVLASLMSSRPWVRIPPAPLTGGVAQRPEHSLVRR